MGTGRYGPLLEHGSLAAIPAHVTVSNTSCCTSCGTFRRSLGISRDRSRRPATESAVRDNSTHQQVKSLAQANGPQKSTLQLVTTIVCPNKPAQVAATFEKPSRRRRGEAMSRHAAHDCNCGHLHAQGMQADHGLGLARQTPSGTTEWNGLKHKTNVQDNSIAELFLCVRARTEPDACGFSIKRPNRIQKLLTKSGARRGWPLATLKLGMNSGSIGMSRKKSCKVWQLKTPDHKTLLGMQDHRYVY